MSINRFPSWALGQSNAANNQGLVWDSSLSLWMPKTIVRSVVHGTNITVDNTDPANPVIASTGGLATDVLWDNKGDLVAATGADAAVKLSVGTDGWVLIADSSQPAGVKWGVAPGAGSMSDPTTTKGDLIVRDSTAPARLAVGANNLGLVADSTQTTGVKWGYPLGFQAGSADILPTSPNAKDDEFDGTSSATWTDNPQAPTSWVSNTNRASHLEFLASTAASLYGRNQTVPGSFPYTITAKKAGSNNVTAGAHPGIFLSPASPSGSSPYLAITAIVGTGILRASGTALVGGSWSSSTTLANSSSFPISGPIYFRLKVNSASSVDVQVSADGYAWVTVNAALNPGFTPGVMGICAVGGVATTMYYDFFRVT